MQQDLKTDQTSGKKEPVKELELVRLNYEEHKISKVEARRERSTIEIEMWKTPEGIKAWEDNNALRTDLDNILYEPTPKAAPGHKVAARKPQLTP